MALVEFFFSYLAKYVDHQDFVFGGSGNFTRLQNPKSLNPLLGQNKTQRSREVKGFGPGHRASCD